MSTDRRRTGTTHSGPRPNTSEPTPALLYVTGDERAIRLSYLLQMQGFRAVRCGDGPEIFERACFSTPDAALIVVDDQTLPVSADPIGLVGDFRKKRGIPPMPVLLLAPTAVALRCGMDRNDDLISIEIADTPEFNQALKTYLAGLRSRGSPRAGGAARTPSRDAPATSPPRR